MKKIEVTNCSNCPFCIVDNSKVICYALLKTQQRLLELDEGLLEEDRLNECPLDEGVLVIAKDELIDELESESEEDF